MMPSISIKFSAMLLFGAVGFAGCAVGAARTPDKSAVRTGDQAKKAFLLSDTADAFSNTSAADAKDCSTYARFVGLGLLQRTEIEEQTSKDVAAVWRHVFDRKTDAEKQVVNSDLTSRPAARLSGALEKLSVEKCITPVIAEMERVF